MSLPKDKAWFPAKTYGYGWGVPKKWQGWLVMLGYVGALFAGTPIIRYHPACFIGYVVGMSVLLFAICRWKGEAPRSRWGSDT
jgi:hypothetical protein